MSPSSAQPARAEVPLSDIGDGDRLGATVANVHPTQLRTPPPRPIPRAQKPWCERLHTAEYDRHSPFRIELATRKCRRRSSADPASAANGQGFAKRRHASKGGDFGDPTRCGPRCRRHRTVSNCGHPCQDSHYEPDRPGSGMPGVLPARSVAVIRVSIDRGIPAALGGGRLDALIDDG